MRKKALMLFFLGVGFTSFSQEGTTSAGGGATGSGGSVEYSVGQAFYTTESGSNGSVAQGVQQPFDVSVTTGIENTSINLEVGVYPNPTANYITLSLKDVDYSLFTYQLYNIQGSLLKNSQITSSNMVVTMEELPTATYFLKVSDNDKLIKTFRIVKN